MSLRKKTSAGLFWAGIQQVSGQLVGMIVSIALARLLSPGDFGLMGMIYIFITVGSTMADAGLSPSLIRMLYPQKEDYSTVFHINVLLALLIYGLLFFTAPLIAGFYGEDILKNIIRVYGLVFVFSALSSVQNAILVKDINFKKQFRLSFPSIVLSGAVGIGLAASGFGVWALVWSGVARSAFYTLQLWLSSDWRPSAVFDRERFRYHFRFGSKLAVNELLNNISSSIHPFVMGKFFTPVQTGYFTQTAAIRQFPVSTLLSPINKVAYPALVNLQSNPEKLRATYLKMKRLTLSALIPAMIFGIVLAEPLIVFLLSERWIDATPYLQIACLAGIVSIAGTYNNLMLVIRGKSGQVLKINILHKIFVLLLLAGTISLGIGAVLWSQVVSCLFHYVIGSTAACRTIGYSFRKLILDFLLRLSFGAVMGAGIWGLRIAVSGEIPLIQLAVCVPAGILLYAGLIALFEKEVLQDLQKLLADVFLPERFK